MEKRIKELMETVLLAFPPRHSNRPADLRIIDHRSRHGRDRCDEVSFNRAELEIILKLYGRNVIAGEWRDYAIDHLDDRAVFSVFRRASEVPIYTIEKTPANSRKQGAYSVIAAGGHVLKRGHQLASVLKVLDK
jgi:hypothetical protein